MIKTALFAAAALFATIGTAAPVLADDLVTKDVLVHYGDLDLASVDGQRVFARRIDRAARSACGYESYGRIQHTSTVTCYHKARATARTTMAALVDDARLGG